MNRKNGLALAVSVCLLSAAAPASSVVDCSYTELAPSTWQYVYTVHNPLSQNASMFEVNLGSTATVWDVSSPTGWWFAPPNGSPLHCTWFGNPGYRIPPGGELGPFTFRSDYGPGPGFMYVAGGGESVQTTGWIPNGIGVPEPTTLALLALGGLAVLRRRRGGNPDAESRRTPR